MVTTPTLKETIYDELVSVLATYTGDSETTIESNGQVRVTNRYEGGAFPAITFAAFDTEINRGLGSGIHVHDVTRNADDTIDTIRLRREKELRLDVAAHAAGDDVKAADELYSDVESHFVEFVRDVPPDNQLHSDVEAVRLLGTTDVGQPDDAIRGERLRIDIEYRTYFDVTDIDTMETIDTALDVITASGDVQADNITTT